MCRIASLFLLQRLKGSMSGYARDFNNIETRTVIKSDYHLFLGLKKQLKGRHFSSDMEVIFAAETWLDGQHSVFF